ncbi:GAF domain-containing protein, partial [Rhizobium ruizarguesonis]
MIIDDAAAQHIFSSYPYIGRQKPRSVLCLPLIRQGVLGGLLYLENSLASHVFTEDRARLLVVLRVQVAGHQIVPSHATRG